MSVLEKGPGDKDSTMSLLRFLGLPPSIGSLCNASPLAFCPIPPLQAASAVPLLLFPGLPHSPGSQLQFLSSGSMACPILQAAESRR